MPLSEGTWLHSNRNQVPPSGVASSQCRCSTRSPQRSSLGEGQNVHPNVSSKSSAFVCESDGSADDADLPPGARGEVDFETKRSRLEQWSARASPWAPQLERRGVGGAELKDVGEVLLAWQREDAAPGPAVERKTVERGTRGSERVEAQVLERRGAFRLKSSRPVADSKRPATEVTPPAAGAWPALGRRARLGAQAPGRHGRAFSP